jgi:DNA-binding GntR family transcriptional regulator
MNKEAHDHFRAEAPILAKKAGSATEAAYAGIVDLILSRGLRPGERTSVQTLASRLGLGRMPVKEAVNRLQTEGILTIKGRSGTTVSTVDAASVAQMFALRRCLEDLAAETAPLGVTDADFLMIEGLVLDMRSASVDEPHAPGAGARFVRANASFHAAVVAAARNPFLDRAFKQLQLQFQIVSYLSDRGVDAAAALRRQIEHEDIAAALAARDSRRLRESLRAHSASTERGLMTSLRPSRS